MCDIDIEHERHGQCKEIVVTIIEGEAMKKLLSLVAVIALFASIDAEAGRCGRRNSCAPAACETRCAAPCETVCAPACETQVLETVRQCEPKPVCRTIVCSEPKQVCTEQKIVRCHWVCPPNCQEFSSEEAASAANRGLEGTKGY